MPGPRRDPQEDSESLLARRAFTTVTRLEKAVRRYRLIVWALISAFVLLAVGGVLLWQNIESVHGVTVRTCQAGNTYRSEQTAIWDGFVRLLLKPAQPTARQTKTAEDFIRVLSGDPAVQKQGAAALLAVLSEGATDPETLSRARQFIAFVEQVNAARDCTAVTRAAAAGG
jgi:hypothetical protein